ncbi:hypothetical protein [Nocardia macrotermitis]|uniref:DUF4190 domain-containing protein n=1 Tax=Nocardia macrotermitis TaxID=2585198 RepID=A0A7K0D1T4_9NOCA|nr:hypothetical protein [Nocardia macrotermitis]MQY19683.1 hypothetical protein [Nocardia macrotermitis]
MGPESDNPDASWQYPGGHRPERPGSPADDAAGSWRCPGPDPVPPQDDPPSSPLHPVAGLFSAIAFVCAGLALLSCLWLLGPIGVILGVVGHVRGERLGRWAAVTSVAATVLSLAVYHFAPRDLTLDGPR